MKSVGLAAVVVTLAASIFVSSSARADVPPPDVCTNAGDSCDNAEGPSGKDGTCTASTCERQTPLGVTKYECLRCVASPSAAKAASKSRCAFVRPRARNEYEPFSVLGLLLIRRVRQIRLRASA